MILAGHIFAKIIDMEKIFIIQYTQVGKFINAL